MSNSGDLVAHIENVRETKELGPLLKNPREAAACLVRQLHVARASVLKPTDASRRRSDFRVVWSLRALRYITGGKDFFAPTARVSELEQDRRHFLTIRPAKGSADVSFLGVWMSRDLIYLAPTDAQEEIIRKWTNWYTTEGGSYSYGPPEGVDWYF